MEAPGHGGNQAVVSLSGFDRGTAGGLSSKEAEGSNTRSHGRGKIGSVVPLSGF